jgi:hypothetical protein
MQKLPKEINTLIDTITSDDFESVKPGTKLKLGNIFLYVYDAKHKATLEVWDKLPLVVLLNIPKGKYILGINIHFIPWSYRIKFIKNLQTKNMKIKYKDVLKAWQKAQIPGVYLKYALRKYLVNRIQSNIKIFENPEDQLEIVKNVLPEFVKKSASQTYNDIDKRIRLMKKRLKNK